MWTSVFWSSRRRHTRVASEWTSDVWFSDHAVSSSSNATSVNSVSWSHTIAGSNEILVVGALSRDSTEADRPVVNVTIGRAHVSTPRTDQYPMPTSASRK